MDQTVVLWGKESGRKGLNQTGSKYIASSVNGESGYEGEVASRKELKWVVVKGLINPPHLRQLFAGRIGMCVVKRGSGAFEVVETQWLESAVPLCLFRHAGPAPHHQGDVPDNYPLIAGGELPHTTLRVLWV